MSNAQQYRAKAAEYGELIKHTNVADDIRAFKKSQASFDLLAENEEWLAANFNSIMHAPATDVEDADGKREPGGNQSSPS